MGEHVTTRSNPAIRLYYNNNRVKLLRMSKQYATKDNGNDLLAEVGINDSNGAHKGHTEEVVVGEILTTIDIIVGTMACNNTNLSVYLASHEDLNSFVQCIFAELKEQVQTKDKHVRIANVGTFNRNKNGHLVITDQP